MNSQNELSKDRREFLKNSAKLGIATLGVLGASSSLFGADSAKASNLGSAVPTVTLNNGVKMPMLGFGVLRLGDQKQTQMAVESALELGYRLFDTAQSYGNEEGVGYALKATGVKREELFITVKLFKAFATEALAGKAYEDSLKRLNIDYADLYLIHQPVNDTYGAYRAMSKLYKEKRVRAIGVSNFDPARIMDFVQNQEIKPAVNQVECNPLFQNYATQEILKELGIQMEAWSPLAQGKNNILQNPVLARIGKKYGKSPAQVILRWIHQRGIVAVVKSGNANRQRENLNIFDFNLSTQDINDIAKLDTGKRGLDHQDPARIKWLNEREMIKAQRI
ncbi:aldo/keto reductase [Campylobacter sp. MIT 12-5580]|uniref:aldo/keto reductase n=1 Tax=Campylobacter sp. MIT 12-5580 TaxID=2040651 RepID=UPI001BB1FE7A|nr:aldo/keto reductase [Campylobacter sp. MIT 12-5580]